MIHLGGVFAATAALLSLASATPGATVDSNSWRGPGGLFDAQDPRVRSSGGEPGEVVPDSYIITLKKGTKARDLKSHISRVADIHGQSLRKRDTTGLSITYNGAYGFKGYAGSFDKDTLQYIKNDPQVASVERDIFWALDWISGQDSEVETAGESKVVNRRALTDRPNATWGLSTISHRDKGPTNFLYDSNVGTGDAWAYVIDSGCRTTHTEFAQSTVFQSWSAFGQPPNSDHTDNMGHGTHVAGSIVGKTFGVAPGGRISCVKVFQNGSSPASLILEGYNWAVNDAIQQNRARVSVMSMSLGGPVFIAMNNAVKAANDAGILTIAAAMNNNSEVANVSPAGAPYAIAVGAIDSNWDIAPYSNWGVGVSIFGPGSSVLSAWNTGDTQYRYLSGTSMATPHITGLAVNAINTFGLRGSVDVRRFILFQTPTEYKIGGNLRDSHNKIGFNKATPY